MAMCISQFLTTRITTVPLTTTFSRPVRGSQANCNILTYCASISHSTFKPTFGHTSSQRGSHTAIAAQVVTEGKCACLANMYLSTTQLRESNELGSPITLEAIKSALVTAHDMLICTPYMNGEDLRRQNLLQIVSLCSTSTTSFDKVLTSIANAANDGITTKSLVIGEATRPSMSPFQIDIDITELAAPRRAGCEATLVPATGSNADTGGTLDRHAG